MLEIEMMAFFKKTVFCMAWGPEIQRQPDAI